MKARAGLLVLVPVALPACTAGAPSVTDLKISKMGVVNDLHGSSLVRLGAGRKPSGPVSKGKIHHQVKTAASEIVHALGL